jgi:hypothetical protein
MYYFGVAPTAVDSVAAASVDYDWFSVFETAGHSLLIIMFRLRRGINHRHIDSNAALGLRNPRLRLI